MNDWFKARNIWGAAILSLSDAEAGRLAKALWTYTMTGEQQNLSGAEKGIFAMMLMTLGQDEQANADISKKRAVAGSMGGNQKQANSSKCYQNKQMIANEANATNKNKNKEEDKEDKDNTRTREDMPFGLTDDDIQASLDRDQQIEDAAKSAGLNTSETAMLKARDYASQYGLEKLLDAIKETPLKANRPSWAYVEGILKGNVVKPNDNRRNHGADSEEPRRGKYSFLFDGTEAV